MHLKLKHVLFLLLISLLVVCSKKDQLKIVHEVSGPIKTNCYLLYGNESKEAALIDPGWKIDTLVTFIKDNELDLKYIFVTHGHIDHYYYLPELKKIFPETKWCINRTDYKDIFTEEQWVRENYGQDWINEVSKDTMFLKYIEFDPNTLGKPDIFLEDDQIYKLGTIKIKTIFTPGHSPGGICLYTQDKLFSGDVLFYKSVGRTDTQHGSRQDLIKTVKKLYEVFPDSVVVYPGHKKFTSIGFEKKNNKYIKVNGGKWIDETDS